jgi:hypothetical protein
MKAGFSVRDPARAVIIWFPIVGSFPQDETKPQRIPENWVRYGRESRSAESFRQNLNAILDLASQRGDRLLLMTFATYVPEDYSREAFKHKQLDYALHRAPIQWWGLPENVLATVAVHNEIVRSVASVVALAVIPASFLLNSIVFAGSRAFGLSSRTRSVPFASVRRYSATSPRSVPNVTASSSANRGWAQALICST